MARELTGKNLTLEDIEAVSLGGETVDLSEQARSQVRASRQVVQDILSEERVVYGINTGFGNFRTVIIPRSDLEQLQINLIRSHAAGVGDPFSEDVVRAVLLLRINALAAMLNGGVHPVVPQKGSVGASGDLAPLAQMALVLEVTSGRRETSGPRVDSHDLSELINSSARRVALL